MVFLKEASWRYGELSDVILFQREDMILFLNIFYGVILLNLLTFKEEKNCQVLY